MEDETKDGLAVGVLVLFVVVVLWLLTTVVIVPTGNTGIVTQFGKVTGRDMQPGLNFKAPFPFQGATILNTQVQKEQQDASASSSDLQDVKTTVAVNYHLDNAKVSSIYQNIGIDYKEKLIDPAIQESVKATTAKYTATDLINNRSSVKDAVEAALVARLNPIGIVVDATSIVNFTFSDEFNKAIEAKQVAQQNVLAEQQNLDKIKVQAEETVTQAQAQHDANALLEQSLTPEILEKAAIDKWDGKLPTTQAGAGTIFSLPIASK